MSLIVLCTADLDTALAFYSALGFTFVQERHGTGPVHYACELGSLVIELFPGKPGRAPDRREAGATMMGFGVEDVDSVVDTISTLGSVILTEPQDSAWGRRAVVQDPDGRAVELTAMR